jgi:NADH dehydrogenase
LELQTLLSPADWLPHLAQIDVLINCAGILRQRLGERYEAVHHHLPRALAQACAQQGVRFLHTSALGLHADAASRFLASKWRGEQAIAASQADYCIVRPSLIDGVGGFGASWLRMLASARVHFVPQGAKGRIAALQVGDLAQAFAVLAQRQSLATQRQANLGGERSFSYREYLQMLRGVERAQAPAVPALQIMLPNWLVRLGAHLCDLLRFSPFSYGHWILLQRDNLPQPNALPALLGRAPQPVVYSRVGLREDFRLS